MGLVGHWLAVSQSVLVILPITQHPMALGLYQPLHPVLPAQGVGDTAEPLAVAGCSVLLSQGLSRGTAFSPSIVWICLQDVSDLGSALYLHKYISRSSIQAVS